MNLRVNNVSFRPNFKGSVTVVGRTKMYYGKVNNACDTKSLKQINTDEIDGIYKGSNGNPEVVLKDNTVIKVKSASYKELKKAVKKEKDTDMISNTSLLGNYMTARMDTEFFY